MKWIRNKIRKLTKSFLVLPLEVYDFTTIRKKIAMVRKKPNLKLFVPHNKENTNEEHQRPATATLEKPEILDIKFLGKIDMSLVRKEFLTITNLCKIPITRKNNTSENYSKCTKKKKKTMFKTYRKKAFQKIVDNTDDETSGSRDEKISSEPKSFVSHSVIKNIDNSSKQKVGVKQINQTSIITCQRPALVSHNLNDVIKPLGSNRNNRNKCAIITPDAILNKDSIKSTKQQPSSLLSCSSCGRSDRPERFHTHPNRKVLVSSGKIGSMPLKINDKSKVGSRKDSENRQNDYGNGDGNNNNVSSVKKKGPRTLICYLCGREYGTASLKLHEPKCIEKWERENSKLPRHLRRKLPQKPDETQTAENWNNNAWKVMQESLVPCKNCGRTFLPDRLEVHQRSCKSTEGYQANITNNWKNNCSRNNNINLCPPKNTKLATVPKGVQCNSCCKNFGTHSIKIHQEQCVLKLDNNKDVKINIQSDRINKDLLTQDIKDNVGEEKANSGSGKRPRILPCYICGRPFSISSIHIHEPQCLKKWNIQNDKLSPEKRRPEPKRPDYVFTPLGKLDCEATFDRMWDNHLSELIPCKFCQRTFFPDRIEKHEDACSKKGTTSRILR